MRCIMNEPIATITESKVSMRFEEMYIFTVMKFIPLSKIHKKPFLNTIIKYYR